MEPLGGFRWRPGIGDPTVGGWITVLAYALTAWLCFRVRSSDPRMYLFWRGLGVLMIALGINKQLDLQSAVTEAGRWIVRRQGWYDQRHELQLVFVAVVGCVGIVVLVALAWFLRSVLSQAAVALVGLSVLVGFVVVRAASFHHVDRWINLRVLGAKMNWIMELGGLAIIAWAAWNARRQGHPRGRPR